ncbi:uncharacterized protein LOC128681190 [Plodia interpunctella]|uniref:uncharacterized protein LOC128681190 n=1 Tax=Plodia interpunctella TaxID=58824 RepID=UPI002368EDE7|nr:uncharacterized protein LOC128681190 isoform X2 [Plodia interpunctella]
MRCKICVILFYIPCFIETVNVDVEGFIALSTEVKISDELSIEENPFNYLRKSQSGKKKKKTSKHTLRGNVTDANESEHNNHTHKPRKVEDIKDVEDFARHVFKNSIKTIKSINRRLDKNLRSKANFSEEAYKWRFIRFINDSLSHTMRTESGTQKFVLNTIQTSNNILRRLTNYFLLNTFKQGPGGNVEETLLKEIDRNNKKEYKYICQRYHICRSDKSFSSFLGEFTSIMATLDSSQLKTANNALTEVLKETDVSKIMDKSTEATFKKTINNLEIIDGSAMKPAIIILKNIFINRNKPLPILREMRVSVSTLTVPIQAVNNILDAFDMALPPTRHNKLEWSQINNSFKEWRDGKRTDILQIVQRLVSHMDKGVDLMDSAAREQMKKDFKALYPKVSKTQ